MTRAAIKALIALGMVGGLVVAAIFLPIGQYALEFVEFVRDIGVLGILLYGAIYAVATILLVPGSLLTIGAGFVYGLWGVALVLPASMLGAIGAFLLGRFFARDWVGRRIAKYDRLAAVDDAIGDKSFTIIFLLRLSPVVPFSLLNYFLGVTRAKLSVYIWASLTGMLPGIFLYVYIGTLMTDAAQLASGDRPDTGVLGQALLIGGLVATFIVTVLISTIAKRKLEERLAETNG